MEAWNAQLPLLRQILLRSTRTGHGAGGDIQKTSLLCAVKNLGRSSRLLVHCSNALCLLGCHRLTDRGQLKGDADGFLPSQGHPLGAAVLAIQPLSIHRHPILEHPKHHNENMHADRGGCPFHERGHPLPPTLPRQDAIKGPAPMISQFQQI